MIFHERIMQSRLFRTQQKRLDVTGNFPVFPYKYGFCFLKKISIGDSWLPNYEMKVVDESSEGSSQDLELILRFWIQSAVFTFLPKTEF